MSFDTKDISTAIDSITVSSEKVSVMFSSQEKVYDYTFTGNLSELVSELEKFMKEQHLSLGRYFNNLVKDGKLTQMKWKSKLLYNLWVRQKERQMAKTWNNRGRNRAGSFSQKKREYFEQSDLESSGYLDQISNSKRIKSGSNSLYVDDDYTTEEWC